MANKKISQLTTKSVINTTDLIFVGDPSTGTLYKKTVSDLQSILTGTVGGSGSATYIPKWSASSTLTNSLISENASGSLGYGGAVYTYKHNFQQAGDAIISFTSVAPFGNNWNMIVSHDAAGNYKSLIYKGANYSWYNSAGTTMAFLSENGNLCINNTDNGYKLDVGGTIRATGDVIAYSDERVKDNIEPIENALDKVCHLRGVSYNRKDLKDKTTKIGYIAQELKEVLPEVVFEDMHGFFGVSYGNISALHTEAIKLLVGRINELEDKLNEFTK